MHPFNKACQGLYLKQFQLIKRLQCHTVDKVCKHKFPLFARGKSKSKVINLFHSQEIMDFNSEQALQLCNHNYDTKP